MHATISTFKLKMEPTKSEKHHAIVFSNQIALKHFVIEGSSNGFLTRATKRNDSLANFCQLAHPVVKFDRQTSQTPS